MEARLPKDKVEKVRKELNAWLNRKSATLQELQSQIGLLNFARKVFPPGRPFWQRMILLTRGVKQSHRHIKLNAGFHEDVKMWQKFIDNWNGKNLFLTLCGRPRTLSSCLLMQQQLKVMGVYSRQVGSKGDGHLATRWAREVSILTGRSYLQL